MDEVTAGVGENTKRRFLLRTLQRNLTGLPTKNEVGATLPWSGKSHELENRKAVIRFPADCGIIFSSPLRPDCIWTHPICPALIGRGVKQMVPFHPLLKLGRNGAKLPLFMSS
jgi:hypothetical protein